MASQAEHHNVNVNMAFQQDHYCLQHDAKVVWWYHSEDLSFSIYHE